MWKFPSHSDSPMMSSGASGRTAQHLPVGLVLVRVPPTTAVVERHPLGGAHHPSSLGDLLIDDVDAVGSVHWLVGFVGAGGHLDPQPLVVGPQAACSTVPSGRSTEATAEGARSWALRR